MNHLKAATNASDVKFETKSRSTALTERETKRKIIIIMLSQFTLPYFTCKGPIYI